MVNEDDKDYEPLFLKEVRVGTPEEAKEKRPGFDVEETLLTAEELKSGATIHIPEDGGQPRIDLSAATFEGGALTIPLPEGATVNEDGQTFTMPDGGIFRPYVISGGTPGAGESSETAGLPQGGCASLPPRSGNGGGGSSAAVNHSIEGFSSGSSFDAEIHDIHAAAAEAMQAASGAATRRGFGVMTVVYDETGAFQWRAHGVNVTFATGLLYRCILALVVKNNG